MKNQKGKETTIRRRKLIDAETGEELETAEILQTTDMKDYDFDKVWIGHLAMICGMMGYAKIRVLAWMMENRDRRNNQIIATQEEIAQGAKVGVATVARAIADLVEGDALSVVRGGLYRLNSNLIVYGGPEKRVNIFYSYQEERDKMEKKKTPLKPKKKQKATPA